MLKLINILFCLMLFLTNLHSQNSIDEMLLKLKTEELAYDAIENYVSEKKYQNEYDQIQSYLLDEDENVRYFLYKLIYQIIKQDEEERFRRELLYDLVNIGLNDSDNGNTYYLLDCFEELPVNLFDARIKNRLSTIILSEPVHFNKLLRLAGRVQIIELVSYLELKLGDEKKINKSEVWNLNLALARMGDETKAQYCLDKFKRLSVNDEVIYRLVPDLIYTRQKIAFDYILELILSDEFNCTSTDPDNEIPILCAYRLIEMIASYLNEFPVSVLSTGELAIEDYEEALMLVRQWIIENKESYQIITE